MKHVAPISLIMTVFAIASLGQAVQAQESEVEIRRGEVLQVAGNTVLIRIEGEGVKRYTIPSDFRFNHEGNEITVNQLREGMVLTGVRLRTTGAADVEDIESAMAEIAEAPPETTADTAAESMEAESAAAESTEAPARTAAPATETRAAEETTARPIAEEEAAASTEEGMGMSAPLIVGVIVLLLVVVLVVVRGLGGPGVKKARK
ncbi:MAG: hypothetical protein ACRD1X_10630 [Vicinamibacteria bacterium]